MCVPLLIPEKVCSSLDSKSLEICSDLAAATKQPLEPVQAKKYITQTISENYIKTHILFYV